MRYENAEGQNRLPPFAESKGYGVSALTGREERKVKSENLAQTQAPSDEGAVVFRRKMTEGEITKI